MKRFSISKVFGFILLAALGVLVFSGAVMLLWNALLPVLFHFPVITLWQALGLLLLSKILFGGFRGGGPRGSWKNKLKQQWMNMTPEEKEKFQQNRAGRCGPFQGKGSFRNGGRFAGEGPVPAGTTPSSENPQ